MSGAKGADLDTMVQQMAQEKVKEAIAESGFVQPPEPSPEPPSSAEEDHIVSLIQRIPAGEGYYFKVYRKHPVPREYGNRPVFLMDLQNPESINDLEAECSELAKKFSWPDGIYEVRLFKTGEPGCQGTWTISLEVPKPAPLTLPSTFSSPGGGTNPFEHLSQTAEFITQLADKVGGGRQNPSETFKVASDAFKQGMEVSGRTAQTQTDPVGLVKAIVDAARSLAPQRSDTKDLIEALKEAGFGREKDDFLDKMIKLKEVGFLPGNQPDMTDKLLNIVTALAPLMGGGGEKTSPVVELIRVLGPQVAPIVKDITDTAKQAIAARSGAPIQVGTTPGVPPPALPPAPGSSPGETPRVPVPRPDIPEESMLPVFKVILMNARQKREIFYPELKEILTGSLPGPRYEAIISGAVPLEDFMEELVPYVGANFDAPVVKEYFQAFIAWVNASKKPAAPPSPPPPSEVVTGKCSKCGALFDYPNKAAWEADKSCDDPNCFGEIQLLPAESGSNGNGGERAVGT